MTARDTATAFDRAVSWDRQRPPKPQAWWWSADEDNLSWPAVLLLLAITGACVLAALVVGQRWQHDRCAAAAETTSACVGWAS